MTDEIVRRPSRHSGARRILLFPSSMLASIVVIFAILAYFPFDWDPPRVVRNDVTRIANGDLRFGDQNFARSSDSPDWLAASQKSGRIEINVEARPEAAVAIPTSIMMLARDFWHTSFAIGQENTDLLVWIRRPGSNDNGDPPFLVADVFRPGRWSSVGAEIADAELTLTVDGEARLRERLPPDTLRAWEGGRIALGDEINGGNGWRGDIRRAEIATAGDSIDYIRSDALAVPSTHFYFPDHVTPFPPPTTVEWFVLGLHLLSFIPVGFLLMWITRPALRVRSATVIAFGIALGLAAGKFFFAGRHTSVADLVMQLLGGLIGAMLGARALRAERSRHQA